MYKATLIKGKTFSLGKYTFDSECLKSQIISDEFVELLRKTGKFKLDKIGEVKDKLEVIKPETKGSKFTFITGHISKVDGYGCLGNRILEKYSTVVQTARDDLNYDKSKSKDLGDIPKDNIILQLTSPNRFKKIEGFKKVIGFTMFENTKIPKEWPELIENT